MNFFKKMFGGIEMTWKLLLVYSVLNGVIVGLLNCVPFLEGTSLVAPAVSYEYWFVAALFVITNCKSAKETMLKTFIFFLISQPLIYLVEVPFKPLGWELFRYYKIWFLPTIMTIPGSWIAYQVRRDNVLSSLILSVATGFLFFTGIGSVKGCIASFPKGLLTISFCIAFAIILIQTLLNKKSTRIIAYICSLLLAAALAFYAFTIQSERTAGTSLDSDHQWELVQADEDVTVEVRDGFMTVTGKKNGSYQIVLQNEEGERMIYEAVFGDGTMELRPLE